MATFELVDLRDSSGVQIHNVIDVDGQRVTTFGLPPGEAAEIIHNLVNLPIRDDDVMVCAAARSGTHWVYEVISMLLKGKAVNTPMPKMASMLETHPREKLEELPSPRILNSHLPLYVLPRQIKEKKTKIVLVLRNPKDVLVSYFHHLVGLKNFSYDGKITDYFEVFMEGRLVFYFLQRSNSPIAPEYMYENSNNKKYTIPFSREISDQLNVMLRQITVISKYSDASYGIWLDQSSILIHSAEFGDWFDFVRGMEKEIEKGDYVFHVVYYEDMKENGLEEITKLARFLEAPNNEDLCKAIYEKCQFEKMAKDKEYPEEVRERFFRHGYHNFRKGQIGDWKNYFTEAMNERFDQIYNEKMKGSKFNFRFEAS